MEKTMVLRKQGHWYVLNSTSGDEREILLTLLEYAEAQRFNIERDEVNSLIDRLGWELEVHENMEVA